LAFLALRTLISSWGFGAIRTNAPMIRFVSSRSSGRFAMIAYPLQSSRVKINRANEHFANFQQAVKAFSERNPNPIRTDEHFEPGIKIDRFQVRDPIPVEFSAFIGDICHNLMSALDSLAVSLVDRGGKVVLTEEVLRDTYFPISWEPGFRGERTARFFERIGSDAEKIIRGLEPYKGGKSDDLFRLWRLNVIDKHRAIVPVAADLLGVQFILPGQDGPPLPPRTYARKPRFPLKHGDELARRHFGEPEYHAHAHFILQIAFGEGQVFEGKPVFPTLEDLLDLVERTIDVFARALFSNLDSGW
jgi:hypothetical protein